jgi:hypothetical protein
MSTIHRVMVTALEKTPQGAWRSHRTEIPEHIPSDTAQSLGVEGLTAGGFFVYLRTMLPKAPEDRYGWSFAVDGAEVARWFPEDVVEAQEAWNLECKDWEDMSVSDLMKRAFARMSGKGDES